MDCKFSDKPAGEYCVIGSRFSRKKCPLCGKIFDLADDAVFPKHDPEPIGRPKRKLESTLTKPGRKRASRQQTRK
jgi:hypothetical protein